MKFLRNALCLALTLLLLVSCFACSKKQDLDEETTGTEAQSESESGSDTTPADKDDTTDPTPGGDTGNEDDGDDTPTPPAKPNITSKALKSTLGCVRLVGDRARVLDSGIALDYMGQGFELALKLVGDKISFPISGQGTFRVWVDGTAWKNAAGNELHTLDVGSFIQLTGLTAGDHVIRILKTDSSDTRATVSAAVFDGTLADSITATPKDLYIEFVGDGSLMKGADLTACYPYLVANALSADYMISAWSGAKAETAKTDYGFVNPHDTADRQAYTPTRHANAIVLSIGASDTVTAAQFDTLYGNLVRSLYKTHGKTVKLYCVYDGAHPYKDAIADLCERFGGTASGIYAVALTGSTEAERAEQLKVLIADTVDDTVAPMNFSGVGTVVKFSEGVAIPPIKYEIFSILENKNCFNVMGRDMYTSSGVAADWSASGIEFYTEHFGAVYVSGKATKTIQFRVYVNGKETGVISFGTWEGEQEIPGTKSTQMKRDHIRLARLEYVKDGLAEISNVRLLGTLEAWNEERVFIEFIGDSITCGYGSVTNDSKKDGTRTYSYLTADSLDADYSMVAISGIGVQASTGQHNGKGITDFYKYTNYYRNKTELYSPQRQADLVVVNLNTNDGGQGATEEEYKIKLKALISDIRSIHGEDVKIVWIIGQMISSTNKVNGWLADVVNELGGEQSAGIYIMETAKNNSGGGGHPNYESHKTTSEDLLSFIKSKGLL